MYNIKRIELIVKDWVKLKTGFELSDDTISQMVVDIMQVKQCDIHDVVRRSEQLCECEEHTFYEWEKSENKCSDCGKKIY